MKVKLLTPEEWLEFERNSRLSTPADFEHWMEILRRAEEGEPPLEPKFRTLENAEVKRMIEAATNSVKDA